jgi:NAD(P)-dependent dehydrogenase (short-subunit alcohol dehydrogenase family)
MKNNEVLVIIGVGGMGVSVARRVGAGRTIVLADINAAGLNAAAGALTEDGHQVLTQQVDVTSRSSVAALTIDEFGRVIEPGGAGVVIASMAGHMQPALDPELERQLASAPAEKLLGLEACSNITSSQMAYPFAKRANQIRVAAAAATWGERGARINSISPGVISTAMGRLELDSESGTLMRAMVDNSGLRRLGTPEDIAAATEFLLGPSAGFITGTDLLVDGGVVAAIHTGTIDLAKALAER